MRLRCHRGEIYTLVTRIIFSLIPPSTESRPAYHISGADELDIVPTSRSCSATKQSPKDAMTDRAGSAEISGTVVEATLIIGS